MFNDRPTLSGTTTIQGFHTMTLVPPDRGLVLVRGKRWHLVFGAFLNMIAIWGNKEHLTCVFPLWFSHDGPKFSKNVKNQKLGKKKRIYFPPNSRSSLLLFKHPTTTTTIQASYYSSPLSALAGLPWFEGVC